MDNMENREELMRRDVMLVAAAGVSLVAGQSFSPYFDPVFFLLRPFIAGTMLSSPLVLLYITSLFISLMTLLIAGVPAALYERVRGLGESSSVSIGIWLAGTFLLSLPALIAVATGG